MNKSKWQKAVVVISAVLIFSIIGTACSNSPANDLQESPGDGNLHADGRSKPYPETHARSDTKTDPRTYPNAYGAGGIIGGFFLPGNTGRGASTDDGKIVSGRLPGAVG